MFKTGCFIDGHIFLYIRQTAEHSQVTIMQCHISSSVIILTYIHLEVVLELLSSQLYVPQELCC